MSIVYNGQLSPVLCRDVLGQTIRELARKDPNVIYLDCDLMSCIGMLQWSRENPRQAVQCGVGEANMIGVAAGLASAGFKPIAHTFGPFASRRCYDQLFLSAGYAGNDITVVGTDPGVTATLNGGTHMPFEDAALYRAIPGSTVIDVSDAAVLPSLLSQCVDRPGVKYLRVGRKQMARIYADGTYLPIGQAKLLRPGTDVTVFAAGIMLHEALQAAQLLQQQGLSAAVVDLYSIKPLSVQTVVEWAQRTGAVVVAENHSHNGGLYDAVLQTLAENCPVPAACVAVNEQFGAVGAQAYLQQRFGLTAERIVATARAVVDRKG